MTQGTPGSGWGLRCPVCPRTSACARAGLESGCALGILQSSPRRPGPCGRQRGMALASLPQGSQGSLVFLPGQLWDLTWHQVRSLVANADSWVPARPPDLECGAEEARRLCFNTLPGCACGHRNVRAGTQMEPGVWQTTRSPPIHISICPSSTHLCTHHPSFLPSSPGVRAAAVTQGNWALGLWRSHSSGGDGRVSRGPQGADVTGWVT